MKAYVVYMVMITKATESVDGKKHTHKYYLYPVPQNLKDFGINIHWSYKNGKKGAMKFTSKAKAQAIAKANNAKVMEVSV